MYPFPCTAECFYLHSTGNRLFWAMLNQIKEFIQLKMPCRASWNSSFTAPFILPNINLSKIFLNISIYYHHLLSLSSLFLAPGCSIPCPPTQEPLSVGDWVCQSYQQGHMPQCQCQCKGRKTVCTTEAKEGRTTAAKGYLYYCRNG